MFRTVLYMAVLGALLTVAKSDFECFSGKLKSIDENIHSFFGENKEKNCQSGQKEFIDSLQHAIDECSVPVSTNSMKVLLQEVCEPGSELSQTFEESGTCLSLNKGLGAVCKGLYKMDSSLPAKEACLKLKQDIFSCAAESIGGPCGEKAVKALKRVFKTSDSLTDGLCEEVASSASWSSFFRYLHWVAIAVSVLTAIIVIIVRIGRRSASKGFDRQILTNEPV